MPRGVKIYRDCEYRDAIMEVLFKHGALTCGDIAKHIRKNKHKVSNQTYKNLRDTVSNYLRSHTSDNETNKLNLPKGHVDDIFYYDKITKKWSIKSFEYLAFYINQNKSNNRQKQSNKDDRDPSVITFAKKLANHRCEIDPTHKSFETDKGVMFTHGHHLIPWCKRNLFENSIDIVENICVLDMNCHGIIHQGKRDDKVKLLKILYDKKIDGLRKAGFDISFEKLLELYE